MPERTPANRFYHSAKISEAQFKRVLWSFVIDEPLKQASKRTGLSANSLSGIYAKLRVFFTELGVFRDIYEGGDPREGTPKGEDFEGFEYRLIPFHFARIDAKRRTKPTQISEIDYHWNESFWRFNYSILTHGRPSDVIERMMFTHLMAHIRQSGPVGKPARKRAEAEALDRQHLIIRLRWLERNSPYFAEAEPRAQLRAIREDRERRN